MQSAYLTLTNIPAEEWSYRIATGVAVIGRSRKSNIRIPSRFAGVSRRHLELIVDAKGMSIRDLGSSGGTCVNGLWIEKGRSASVMVGDRLWVGGVEINIVAEVSQLAQVMAEMEGLGEDEADTFIEKKYSQSRARALFGRLSPSELDVMLWMCRGYATDEDLGELLSRSPHTVRTQVGSIFKKLELHSRVELVSWLQRSSRLPEESSNKKMALTESDTDHGGFRLPR